jgi:hypothetical protein
MSSIRTAEAASRYGAGARAHGGGNYIARHWRGQTSLGVAYWVNSVVIGNLAPAALMIAMASLEAGNETSLRVDAVLSLLAAALLTALSVWSTVGVLRSAVNHPERGGKLVWSMLAFVMVGLSLITIVIGFSRKNSLDGYADLWQIARGHDPIPVSSVEIAPDGLSVVMSGPIGTGSTERLRQVLEHAPQATTLRLDSPGGRLFEGDAIAREVRRRGLDTYAEGECSSACTLVLLAGHERLTTRAPRVGFHRASHPGPNGTDVAASRGLMRSYREAGLSESFIDRVRMVPSSAIWYPSLDELMANAIVTGIAPDVPPAVAAKPRAAQRR